MARLHSYYRLCPLIDQKSLFGVTADKKSGCVVATLGKNVVNKYRLSDQKQVGGWSSKYHLSAPVIYDSIEDKYIGVFNETIVKFWDDTTVNLDKLKKHKFQQTIWRVWNGKYEVNLIIFKNGSSVSLDYALNCHKSLEHRSILLEDEALMDYNLIKSKDKYILCYIAKSRKNICIIICPLHADTFTVHHKKIKRYSCERTENDKLYVSGYTLSNVHDNSIAFILWSDGKLESFDLILLEWTFIGYVPWISASTPVSISQMDDKHIALYGADLSQEGAILIVYNVSLGIGSCRHPLKMFCIGARLWCLEEKLVLEAVNHLGVLPFALEAERSLATLIGSHEIDECSQLKIANWGEGQVSINVKEEWEELAARGMTERNICLQYFPKLLEQKDNSELLKALGQFNDIPESIVVMLLKYVMGQMNYDTKLMEVEDWQTIYERSPSTISFLNVILSLPFSDADLTPHLQYKFSSRDTVSLIRYFCFLLKSESLDLVDHTFECKLLSWCSLVMDTFYQHYLLQKSQDVISALKSLSNTINYMIDGLSDVENMIPLVENLAKGKTKSNKTTNDNVNYCIEIIKLY